MTDERQDDSGGERPQRRRRDAGERQSPARLARRAADELAELLGRRVEGVVSLQRNGDDGWCVGVEVVEVSRVPETADVLAEYEVSTDSRGRLVEYQRVRRYVRGRADG